LVRLPWGDKLQDGCEPPVNTPKEEKPTRVSLPTRAAVTPLRGLGFGDKTAAIIAKGKPKKATKERARRRDVNGCWWAYFAIPFALLELDLISER
jgi:hypothetical protein